MPRKRADPEIVALLEMLLGEAKRGELHDLFVLMRYRDGSYDEAFYADSDAGDMILELRSAVIRCQCAVGSDTPTSH